MHRSTSQLRLKARVLLAQGDATREQLAAQLEKCEFEVRQTASGAESLQLARDWAEIVLLDWVLKDLSGIDVCQWLRERPDTRDVPIIVLTGQADQTDRLRSFEAGADDCVTKPVDMSELIARIGAVLRRTRPAPPPVLLVAGDLEMNTSSHRVRRGGRNVSLAPVEYRLLRFFLENPARVLSRARIRDSVWGEEADIEAQSVNTHVRRLRRALQQGGGRDPIRTVRTIGYSLDFEA
jgi:two-component system, OmpR family, phosphate regulon response regulator PhoB